jgi:hypothetical protein
MSQIEYENDPEEAICEAFAKEGPKNIIKFRIKTRPGEGLAAEAIAAD